MEASKLVSSAMSVSGGELSLQAQLLYALDGWLLPQYGMGYRGLGSFLNTLSPCPLRAALLPLYSSSSSSSSTTSADAVSLPASSSSSSSASSSTLTPTSSLPASSSSVSFPSFLPTSSVASSSASLSSLHSIIFNGIRICTTESKQIEGGYPIVYDFNRHEILILDAALPRILPNFLAHEFTHAVDTTILGLCGHKQIVPLLAQIFNDYADDRAQLIVNHASLIVNAMLYDQYINELLKMDTYTGDDEVALLSSSAPSSSSASSSSSALPGNLRTVFNRWLGYSETNGYYRPTATSEPLYTAVPSEFLSFHMELIFEALGKEHPEQEYLVLLQVNFRAAKDRIFTPTQLRRQGSSAYLSSEELPYAVELALAPMRSFLGSFIPICHSIVPNLVTALTQIQTKISTVLTSPNLLSAPAPISAGKTTITRAGKRTFSRRETGEKTTQPKNGETDEESKEPLKKVRITPSSTGGGGGGGGLFPCWSAASSFTSSSLQDITEPQPSAPALDYSLPSTLGENQTAQLTLSGLSEVTRDTLSGDLQHIVGVTIAIPPPVSSSSSSSSSSSNSIVITIAGQKALDEVRALLNSTLNTISVGYDCKLSLPSTSSPGKLGFS